MHVGELKARFSDVLKEVQRGEEVVISYGKKGENVAVLIPYSAQHRNNTITRGGLKGRATAVFSADYRMTGEELLGQ